MMVIIPAKILSDIYPIIMMYCGEIGMIGVHRCGGNKIRVRGYEFSKKLGCDTEIIRLFIYILLHI